MPSLNPTRLGAVSAMTGVVVTLTAFGLVFLGVVDPFAEISSAEYLHQISADRTLWLASHLLVCAGLALKVTGLITVAHEIAAAGRRLAAVVAAALAVIGRTLLLATMAFDGYVHGFIAQRWQAASGADRLAWETDFAVSLRGSYGMELTSVLLLLGFASIAFAVGLAGSRLPRWIGRVALVQGLGAIVTTAVLWIGGPSDIGYGGLYPAFAVILPSVWVFAAGWTLWRRPVAAWENPVAASTRAGDGSLPALAGSRS